MRQILAEWERHGQVRIVGADKLAGAPVTLTLVDVPEKQALDIVMRGVPGYMAVDRVAQADAAPAGPSRYDRLVVLARASTPVPAAAPQRRAACLAGAAARRPTRRPCRSRRRRRSRRRSATRRRRRRPDRTTSSASRPSRRCRTAPVASPYPNAYPGSPYIGANGTAARTAATPPRPPRPA